MCGGGGPIIIKERFKRHSNQMQCSLDPDSKKASAKKKPKHFLYNQGNVNMEYLILKKYYSSIHEMILWLFF